MTHTYNVFCKIKVTRVFYQPIGIGASIGFLCKANQPSLILTLHCFERLSRKEIEERKKYERNKIKNVLFEWK